MGSAGAPASVASSPKSHVGEEAKVVLLGGFELRSAAKIVPLRMNPQRLAAFLAIHERSVLRSYVAGTLWPDTTEDRAGGNLRSALWRLGKSVGGLVLATTTHVGISPTVRVDLREATALARQLLAGADHEDAHLTLISISGTLLPGWYDDWVLMERERFRQLRLHALEMLCQQLSAAGMYHHAVAAGLEAVAAEPLSESAHRGLVKAHLAEGNRSQALAQCHAFRESLKRELGVPPSALMEELALSIGT